MTIALETQLLGRNCAHCTDSMDSDGYSKTSVDKIWCYETQNEWGDLPLQVPASQTS